jgi:hypothetical protein
MKKRNRRASGSLGSGRLGVQLPTFSGIDAVTRTLDCDGSTPLFFWTSA